MDTTREKRCKMEDKKNKTPTTKETEKKNVKKFTFIARLL